MVFLLRLLRFRDPERNQLMVACNFWGTNLYVIGLFDINISRIVW